MRKLRSNARRGARRLVPQVAAALIVLLLVAGVALATRHSSNPLTRASAPSAGTEAHNDYVSPSTTPYDPRRSATPTASPAHSTTSPAPHPTTSTSPRPPTSQSARPSPMPSGPVPSPTRLAKAGQCASNPHACGYPDGSNTGVPEGTSLRRVPQQVRSGRGWYWDSAGWIVANKKGAVISGISVDASISVEAPDVTIKDSYVNCDSQCSFAVIIRDTSTGAAADANDALIENSTITDTSDTTGVGIEAENVSNTQVVSDNLSGEGVGVLFTSSGGGVVKDSYIHDLAYCCGYHNEDIQSTAGGNVLIEHNTLFNDAQQTAEVRIGQDFGSQTNVTIEDNLLAGGGYAIYGGDEGDDNVSPATDIRVLDNRLSSLYFSHCGYYGWIVDFNTPPGAGDVASGNYWDGSGRPASVN
jgi:hypothetical protein